MKCSEEQHSLEIEQETESSTLPLGQTKPAQFAVWLLASRGAVTERQGEHLGTALSYRAFGRDLSKAARRWSALPKFLSFNLSCSLSLPWGKGILYSRTMYAKQQSKATEGQWTKGESQNVPFYFQGRVTDAAAVLHNVGWREGEQWLVPEVTSIPSLLHRVLQPWFLRELPDKDHVQHWAALAALQAMLK